ncbi:lytic murein transglycosylase [Lutimaribacter sp. EGI FJ00015]|uniref:Lytic murein transglycosylase n=1 Tax=Lutimaribacter degradans TaxID=2945989 RepID=A0ACC5ZS41_9RHOB|nr:lytic murein transglycosylase [Lutimaribacter sp. EGI FJ00013]MCM2560995.1 lytic murein transglycosylase [Lutimaribacter sp. EGI FJ00013]MCO0612058.1 lytic murein transglycosylase [Lutimaribacter sp. EGI FJ00015]MCO0634822.1 lytic murein transglycosylase [Lutimaribacter sp. EGI FJ00014]
MRRFLFSLFLVGLSLPAAAAPCGNSAAGFDAWKADFATTAQRAGVGQRGLQALASARYATGTIAADRNQKSFRYSLEKFMQIRGAATIVRQGRQRKARDARFYDALEKRFGVPAGVIIAIHGMETGFGGFMGDSAVVSAIVTLAYDCRRSDFFIPHALGALQLVDKGSITATTRGAKHGELGHTQFLPGNALKYGVDANGDGRVDFYDQSDALASTAHYLRQKGWQPGQPYHKGTHNYRVLKEWNAASVYQESLAIMGAQIDG